MRLTEDCIWNSFFWLPYTMISCSVVAESVRAESAGVGVPTGSPAGIAGS